MLFNRTNIEGKLSTLRSEVTTSEKVLLEVQEILKTHTTYEDRIQKNITSTYTQLTNKFEFDLLETDRIFHIDQIKQICIDYRLRFLNSKYFKGDIPQEAFAKIKKIEKDHTIEIKGFKIMAPSKLFKLKDKDDPLLFAPIGNDYFYLIHKWGNDLHPLRKILVWPFKNIINLIILVFLISLIITLMVPGGLFSKSNTSAEFWILAFFMFKSIAAVVIFYGFALGKNFNPEIWNSKYYNA